MNSYTVSLSTALLFGVHPMHVESVAWVTERKDLLYALFTLASLLSYVRFARTGAARHCWLSVLLMVLSLMSKPQAILLPAVLVLVDWVMFRPLRLGVLAEKIPFLLVSGLFFVVNTVGLTRTSNIRGDHVQAFIGNLGEASYAIVWYLIKLLLPTNLSCIYPRAASQDGFDYALQFVSPIVLAFLGLVIARSMKYTRKIAFAGMFFLINLVIPIYSAPSQHSPVYDRYEYLPSLGILYVACEGLAWVYRHDWKHSRIARALVLLALLTVTGLFSFQTSSRCRVWKDSYTLWSDAVEKYPENAIARTSLGVALEQLGRLDEALKSYREALRIDPRHKNAHLNLGLVAMERGELDKAREHFEQALRSDPRDARAHQSLGLVLMARGELDKALEHFEQALSSNPRDAWIHNNIGVALARKGRLDEAVVHFEQALLLQPDNASAKRNLDAAVGSRRK